MQAVPKIPGYELLKPLGGGPLTCVYQARDCAADGLCAVKVLRPEWEEQPAGIKLLQREARTGLAVQHPHLVRLREAHVTRAPYFLVMELLAGESLRGRLKREYRVEPAMALWITRQTAEALAALHRAGFVHGDVKPDNIRIIDDGTAKLLDLGFSHRPGENATLLRQGYLLGTANYLAPELCAYDPAADERADIFSLGVTLFEMLTGRLPYPPGSTKQTLRRHRCDPPADLRQHQEAVPAALLTLVNRLMSRHAPDRPRASAIVQQLIALEIAILQRRRSA
jgi:serine/threonine protein kinase